eukprot:1799020-Pleurochrysis_carterae.AAC.2
MHEAPSPASSFSSRRKVAGTVTVEVREDYLEVFFERSEYVPLVVLQVCQLSAPVEKRCPLGRLELLSGLPKDNTPTRTPSTKARRLHCPCQQARGSLKEHKRHISERAKWPKCKQQKPSGLLAGQGIHTCPGFHAGRRGTGKSRAVPGGGATSAGRVDRAVLLRITTSPRRAEKSFPAKVACRALNHSFSLVMA